MKTLRGRKPCFDKSLLRRAKPEVTFDDPCVLMRSGRRGRRKSERRRRKEKEEGGKKKEMEKERGRENDWENENDWRKEIEWANSIVVLIAPTKVRR